uniref:Retrovirus-related Pol polyprotein from transposon TNT 1-94 n=1 Tax=Tanacetum cinerariifolium TaxID=118510 RepID=A0A6L2LK80_TANCI|nr:hypothetical protein [Tanacetum cinerariifolium]
MYTMNESVYNQQSQYAPVNHQASVIYPQSFQAPVVPLQSPAAFPQFDSGLVVPSFLPIDDPIASFKKWHLFAPSFTPIYPPINNQLKNSSNPRNQVTMQGRQTQSYGGNRTKGNAISAGVISDTRNSTTNQSKVIQCYNYKGDGHFARVELDAEQLALLVDAGKSVDSSTNAYTLITNDIFHINGIESFDSDCEEVPAAKETFMINLSYYDLDVLSEETSNQVAKCNTDNQKNKPVNESLTVELKRYKEQIKIFKEKHKFNLNDREKYIHSQLREVIVDRNAKVEDFGNQIHSLKLQLNATVESHKTLSTTVDVLKMESKEKKDKSLEVIIELEKKKKALDNVVYKMGQSTQMMHMLIKPQAFYDESYKTALGYQNSLYLTQAQRKVPTLYCGNTVAKHHDALYVTDTKETLILAKEGRIKMLEKQNNPIMKEKKLDITPIDYVALNKLSEHFVPQKQLYA